MTAVYANGTPSGEWGPKMDHLKKNGYEKPHRRNHNNVVHKRFTNLNGVNGGYNDVSLSASVVNGFGVRGMTTNNNINSSTWAAALIPTPPDSPPPNTPFNKGLVTPATTKLGLRNLLEVPTGNADNYFLTRQCSYIFYCSRIKVSCNYPKLTNKSIVEDERVEEAIERTISEELEDDKLDLGDNGRYPNLLSKYKKQATKTMNNMKAALSATLIRLTGYILFKVFKFLLMSVTVNEGQLQMIEQASKRNIPLIFMPLHRSHVDYLFVTWILFNREIPAPIVAAGDNLRMPIFGWLLRGLGGFFIKRKLESTKSRKDYVYRAILQSYMSQALHAGYNLEFFIEGGRTRTGKPCLPKGGLLSVIVDSYINGTLDDALIVPIAINYDRILDGNFIREQLGQKKVPESFWRAVTAIAKVLTTNYGHSRIDFGQPFSLNEFFQSSKLYLANNKSLTQDSVSVPQYDLNPMSNGHHRSNSSPSNQLNSYQPPTSNGFLHTTRSNSSLFGSEVTEGYRELVDSLAKHVVYDAEKCQAIMSTNAVAWLLSFSHREGVTLDQLALSVQRLQEDLRSKGRDTGFSGDALDATIHAITMLGISLVHVDGKILSDDPKRVIVKPLTVYPNLIELNYYANALLPLYAVDSIVATSLLTMADCDLWSYRDMENDCMISQNKLLERSIRLCDLLRNEFVFVPPCGSLEDRLCQSINDLVSTGLLIYHSSSKQKVYSKRYTDDIDDDDLEDDEDRQEDTYYHLCPTSSNLEKVATVTRAMSPLIESYYGTVLNLNTLIGRSCVDQDFISEVQKSIKVLLKRGMLLYGECVAIDPIRNMVKVLEMDNVLQSYQSNSSKVLFLHKEYESEKRLWSIQEEIGSYRV